MKDELFISKAQASEFSWLASGQIINLLLGFISIKLMTSVGPDQYGEFILASSIMGILTLVYFGPLEQGYIRQYFNYTNDPHSRNVFLESLIRVLKWSLVGLIILASISIITGKYYLNANPLFMICASIMICIGASFVPVQGMMNALRLRKQAAMVQIVEKILTILFLAFLFTYWQKNIIVLFLCVIMGTGFGSTLRLLIYREQYVSRLNSNGDKARISDNYLKKEIRTRIINYSMPFFLWGGISWIQLNGERWVINHLLNTVEVGRYGLAATLLNSTVVIAATVLAQFLTPIIYKHFSNQDPIEIKRGWSIIRLQSWITFYMFAGFALLFLFCGKYLIRIISSDAYAIQDWILCLFTFGLGLFYVSQALTNVGLSLQKPQIYIAPKIITTFISIIAYYIGCNYYGIAGVVGAIAAVNLLYLVLVLSVNRRLILSIK